MGTFKRVYAGGWRFATAVYATAHAASQARVCNDKGKEHSHACQVTLCARKHTQTHTHNHTITDPIARSRDKHASDADRELGAARAT